MYIPVFYCFKYPVSSISHTNGFSSLNFSIVSTLIHIYLSVCCTFIRKICWIWLISSKKNGYCPAKTMSYECSRWSYLRKKIGLTVSFRGQASGWCFVFEGFRAICPFRIFPFEGFKWHSWRPYFDFRMLWHIRASHFPNCALPLSGSYFHFSLPTFSSSYWQCSNYDVLLLPFTLSSSTKLRFCCLTLHSNFRFPLSIHHFPPLSFPLFAKVFRFQPKVVNSWSEIMFKFSDFCIFLHPIWPVFQPTRSFPHLIFCSFPSILRLFSEATFCLLQTFSVFLSRFLLKMLRQGCSEC